MNVFELCDLPRGDDSLQYRMLSEKTRGYVDFAILEGEMCAHTWNCPKEGRIFLRELEKYAEIHRLKLTVPTVLSPRLEKILVDNGYKMKKIPYLVGGVVEDTLELWSKEEKPTDVGV